MPYIKPYIAFLMSSRISRKRRDAEPMLLANVRLLPCNMAIQSCPEAANRGWPHQLPTASAKTSVVIDGG